MADHLIRPSKQLSTHFKHGTRQHTEIVRPAKPIFDEKNCIIMVWSNSSVYETSLATYNSDVAAYDTAYAGKSNYAAIGLIALLHASQDPPWPVLDDLKHSEADWPDGVTTYEWVPTWTLQNMKDHYEAVASQTVTTATDIYLICDTYGYSSFINMWFGSSYHRLDTNLIFRQFFKWLEDDEGLTVHFSVDRSEIDTFSWEITDEPYIFIDQRWLEQVTAALEDYYD